MMTESYSIKKYGIKSSILPIVFGSIPTLFFLFVHVFLGVLLGILSYVFFANFLSMIGVGREDIMIKDFMIPFSKGKVFRISDIEKIRIQPEAFSGKTYYRFYFRNGKTFSTFNKLLWFERENLIKELESKKIEVI